MTYDGSASTAEKLTPEEIKAMGNKKPKLKVIEGGENEGFFDDNDKDLNKEIPTIKELPQEQKTQPDENKDLFDDEDKNLTEKNSTNEELARQRREQKTQQQEKEGLAELDFLLSVNKPQDTAKRIVELADRAPADRRKREETAAFAQFENQLNKTPQESGHGIIKTLNKNLGEPVIEKSEQEIDLTDQAELIEPPKIPEISTKQISKESERLTNNKTEENFFDKTYEDINNEETDLENTTNWVDKQDQTFGKLSKNDQLNLSTLRDLKLAGKENKTVFINLLNSFTKTEQERIIPLLVSEERQNNQEPWVINWINSPDRKFSPEPTRWQKIKNFFGRS